MEKLKKQNVLVMFSRCPYPPISGEKIKAFETLKALNEKFKVHCIIIADVTSNEEDFNECKKYCRSLKVFKRSKLQFLLAMLKSLLNKKPLQINYYFFSEIKHYVDSLENIDLVYSYLIRTAEYVRHLKAPKILDMTDSLYLHYKNALKKSSNFLWKFIYRLEVGRLKNYEADLLKDFDRVLLVNPAEVKLFLKAQFKAREDAADRASENSAMKSPNTSTVKWLRIGLREELFARAPVQPEEREVARFVFFGKMDYQPNVEAALWFIKNILPALSKSTVFDVVGGQPHPLLLAQAKKNPKVIVSGFLPDPFERLSSATALVAPMQTGGGVQNKILEAMAIGLPVVTNLNPVAGLADLSPEQHFLVCKDKEAWIRELTFLSTHPQFKRLSFERAKRARKTVKAFYSWASYRQNVQTECFDVLIQNATKKLSGR